MGLFNCQNLKKVFIENRKLERQQSVSPLLSRGYLTIQIYLKQMKTTNMKKISSRLIPRNTCLSGGRSFKWTA